MGKIYRQLAGKVAIVTGAGTSGEGMGTGKATALLFAAEGAKVCLVDRDEKAAADTLAMITEQGGEAFVALADITDEAACACVVADTCDRFGGLDILVNNVGITGPAVSIQEIDIAAWQQVFDVNLRSMVLLTKLALPALIARGGGAIVNVSSIAGMLAYGTTAYGPSKAAIIAFTRETALLAGRDGIRANVIAPGHIYTPMSARSMDDKGRIARRKLAPSNREGTAWDIAQAAVFLAGDQSTFINGVCIPVDGGAIVTGSLTALHLVGDGL